MLVSDQVHRRFTYLEIFQFYAKKINWMHLTVLAGTPMMALYGFWTTPISLNSGILLGVYYMMTGLGITAGYHRLWAHRSYSATWPVKWFLLLCATGALQGSVKWWCGGHRNHHRYTDTDRDPYNAKRGLLYSHIGWMLEAESSEKIKADIRDLNTDSIIRFQHRNYFWMGPMMSFLFPAMVAHLFWNDFWGGLYYGGALRLFLVHHSTFCVNSIAHYFGEQGYDDNRSPRDSFVTALLTFGEGYHNFHHEFPNDYRNGIRWYDYDPTKWLIALLSSCRLTYHLKQFPHNEIMRGKWAMLNKKLNIFKSQLKWPVSVDQLPEYDWASINTEVKKQRRALLVVDKVVHDVSSFVDSHPGGAIIRSFVGKDASSQFHGADALYNHSRAAHNLLSTYRVGRLRDSRTIENTKEPLASSASPSGPAFTSSVISSLAQ